MSAPRDTDDVIEALQNQLNSLEITVQTLQRRIGNLESQQRTQQRQQCNQRITQPPVIATVVSHESNNTADTPLVSSFDRDGTVIDIGDTDTTLTRGVHRERRGVITRFEGEWTYLRDRTGTEQRRKSTNVRKIRI